MKLSHTRHETRERDTKQASNKKQQEPIDEGTKNSTSCVSRAFPLPLMRWECSLSSFYPRSSLSPYLYLPPPSSWFVSAQVLGDDYLDLPDTHAAW